MTVGQLIQRLKRFDVNMPVVVRTKEHGMLEDFKDLSVSDIVELRTKEVFDESYQGVQIYDASEGPREKPIKVLSLTGGTLLQRGSYESKN